MMRALRLSAVILSFFSVPARAAAEFKVESITSLPSLDWKVENVVVVGDGIALVARHKDEHILLPVNVVIQRAEAVALYPSVGTSEVMFGVERREHGTVVKLDGKTVVDTTRVFFALRKKSGWICAHDAGGAVQIIDSNETIKQCEQVLPLRVSAMGSFAYGFKDGHGWHIVWNEENIPVQFNLERLALIASEGISYIQSRNAGELAEPLERRVAVQDNEGRSVVSNWYPGVVDLRVHSAKAFSFIGGRGEKTDLVVNNAIMKEERGAFRLAASLDGRQWVYCKESDGRVTIILADGSEYEARSDSLIAVSPEGKIAYTLSVQSGEVVRTTLIVDGREEGKCYGVNRLSFIGERCLILAQSDVTENRKWYLQFGNDRSEQFDRVLLDGLTEPIPYVVVQSGTEVFRIVVRSR